MILLIINNTFFFLFQVKNDIKVDGKGTDSDIVSNILQDIKSVLL